MYSEDGLVYPAVVLWVKGQRCRVRYDIYNNEEDQDVGALLGANDLHGAAAAKVRVVLLEPGVFGDRVLTLNDPAGRGLDIRRGRRSV